MQRACMAWHRVAHHLVGRIVFVPRRRRSRKLDVGYCERMCCSDTEIFLTSCQSSRVRVLAFDGRELRAWGAYGRAPGQFEDPCALALGPDQTLLVADGTQRIQVLSGTGQFIRYWRHTAFHVMAVVVELEVTPGDSDHACVVLRTLRECIDVCRWRDGTVLHQISRRGWSATRGWNEFRGRDTTMYAALRCLVPSMVVWSHELYAGYAQGMSCMRRADGMPVYRCCDDNDIAAIRKTRVVVAPQGNVIALVNSTELILWC